eukprot:1156851-Pelagomonas_calceolata.AAC.1
MQSVCKQRISIGSQALPADTCHLNIDITLLAMQHNLQQQHHTLTAFLSNQLLKTPITLVS